MAASTPIRIEEELFEAAKAVAPSQNRSAAQQVAHWARIGRAVEASRSISSRAIQEALAGARPYDTLRAEEQAVVRAEWARRVEEDTREGIDLRADLAAADEDWVELGPDGAVVHGAAPR